MKPVRRLARTYARLRYGKVPEPLDRWYAHGGVFWAWSTLETLVEGTWRTLPPPLRNLAVLKAASVVDCPWCLDFGSAVSGKAGLSEDKLRALHAWRDSTVFDDDERLVLSYAENASATPVVVDEELVAALTSRFGEKGVVELTAVIALENQRSRFNASLGVLPQGWSRVCALPTPASSSTGRGAPTPA